MTEDDPRPITRAEIIAEIVDRWFLRIEGEVEFAPLRTQRDPGGTPERERAELERAERERAERERAERERAERERAERERAERERADHGRDASDRVLRAAAERRARDRGRDRARDRGARERALQAKRAAEIKAALQRARESKKRKWIYAATGGITIAELRDIVETVMWLWDLIPLG